MSQCFQFSNSFKSDSKFLIQGLDQIEIYIKRIKCYNRIRKTKYCSCRGDYPGRKGYLIGLAIGGGGKQRNREGVKIKGQNIVDRWRCQHRAW